jgi:hypothetical protein
MMEVTRSSETSVDFERTTRRYIPEDITSSSTETGCFEKTFLTRILGPKTKEVRVGNVTKRADS